MSVHAALNAVRQSTHETRPASVVTGPPQLVPPGMVTYGHVAVKPIVVGGTSPLPPQTRSSPPQTWHVLVIAWERARAMRAIAFGSGQGPDPEPFSRASEHFCRALLSARNALAALLPISR